MQTPSISDAELEVMNILWERSPLTASEVIDALREKTEWHPRTVKTLLGRLVRKEVLQYQTEGNRYVYSPAVARQRFVKAESSSFIARVFGGDTTPALVHFVKNADLTEAEIDDLRRLLDQKKERV